MSQITLLLGAFFGENVAFEGVLPLHLARSGERKTLLSTGFRLYFWHCGIN